MLGFGIEWPGQVEDTLSPVIGSMYTRAVFSKEEKANADDFLAELLESMLRTLLKTKWTGVGARLVVSDESVKWEAGYPAELHQRWLMERAFAGIRAVPRDFFESMMSVKR